MLRETLKKTPAINLLAFLFLIPTSAIAQVLCDNDGIQVDFRNEQAGVVTLNDARTREITGSRQSDRAESVSASGFQTTNFVFGKMLVDSLNAATYPDNGIPIAEIDRASNNAWEINFNRGDYEFNNRNDLDVEVTITVSGGQATHVFQGNSSTVSLEVEDANLNTRWYNGGSNSLRRLQGSVNFRFSDLQQLGFAGIHRATVDICVNIRGQI